MVPQFSPLGRLRHRYDLRNIQFFVERLNQGLERIVRNRANAYMLDADQIAASFGRRYVQDDSITSFNHGNLPPPSLTLPDRLDPIGRLSDYYDLTPASPFRSALLGELRGMLTTIRQEDSVKLVVVDLDDTMWTGASGDATDIGPHGRRLAAGGHRSPAVPPRTRHPACHHQQER